tara:strand:+ start:380 stop:781 length:402 start_codon:yes stop_codon:yes gene_type:complete
MKKSELKKIIKECVTEILFEEGILSNLVAEVAFGITKAQNTIIETKQESSTKAHQIEERSRQKKMLETKRKMLDAMGNSKMSKVFEGTEPLREGGKPGSVTPNSPLSGRDPQDAGIDISKLFGTVGQRWQDLK